VRVPVGICLRHTVVARARSASSASINDGAAVHMQCAKIGRT